MLGTRIQEYVSRRLKLVPQSTAPRHGEQRYTDGRYLASSILPQTPPPPRHPGPPSPTLLVRGTG
ncbi:hypothetical protein J6590_086101 [Homalodisca vitripennis]|nr:hypothetical protein J6590_086101 [Homalodisca vitripennis]